MARLSMEAEGLRSGKLWLGIRALLPAGCPNVQMACSVLLSQLPSPACFCQYPRPSETPSLPPGASGPHLPGPQHPHGRFTLSSSLNLCGASHPRRPTQPASSKSIPETQSLWGFSVQRVSLSPNPVLAAEGVNVEPEALSSVLCPCFTETALKIFLPLG